MLPRTLSVAVLAAGTCAFGGVGNVNYNTGQVSFSNNLTTVTGNRLTFPVSISYNSRLLKNQRASWVGMGFDLDLPFIERTVEGGADDEEGHSVNYADPAQFRSSCLDTLKIAGTQVSVLSFPYIVYHPLVYKVKVPGKAIAEFRHSFAGGDANSCFNTSNGTITDPMCASYTMDTRQDIYSLCNFPGGDRQIFLSSEFKRRSITTNTDYDADSLLAAVNPFAPWKVNYIITSPTVDNAKNATIDKWIIVDQDGVKYTFSEKLYTAATTPTDAVPTNTKGFDNAKLVFMKLDYVANWPTSPSFGIVQKHGSGAGVWRWYLTEMEDLSGEKMTFTYDRLADMTLNESQYFSDIQKTESSDPPRARWEYNKDENVYEFAETEASKANVRAMAGIPAGATIPTGNVTIRFRIRDMVMNMDMKKIAIFCYLKKRRDLFEPNGDAWFKIRGTTTDLDPFPFGCDMASLKADQNSWWAKNVTKAKTAVYGTKSDPYQSTEDDWTNALWNQAVANPNATAQVIITYRDDRFRPTVQSNGQPLPEGYNMRTVVSSSPVYLLEESRDWPANPNADEDFTYTPGVGARTEWSSQGGFMPYPWRCWDATDPYKYFENYGSANGCAKADVVNPPALEEPWGYLDFSKELKFKSDVTITNITLNLYGANGSWDPIVFTKSWDMHIGVWRGMTKTIGEEASMFVPEFHSRYLAHVAEFSPIKSFVYDNDDDWFRISDDMSNPILRESSSSENSQYVANMSGFGVDYDYSKVSREENTGCALQAIDLPIEIPLRDFYIQYKYNLVPEPVETRNYRALLAVNASKKILSPIVPKQITSERQVLTFSRSARPSVNDLGPVNNVALSSLTLTDVVTSEPIQQLNFSYTVSSIDNKRLQLQDIKEKRQLTDANGNAVAGGTKSLYQFTYYTNPSNRLPDDVYFGSLNKGMLSKIVSRSGGTVEYVWEQGLFSRTSDNHVYLLVPPEKNGFRVDSVKQYGPEVPNPVKTDIAYTNGEVQASAATSNRLFRDAMFDPYKSNMIMPQYQIHYAFAYVLTTGISGSTTYCYNETSVDAGLSDSDKRRSGSAMARHSLRYTTNMSTESTVNYYSLNEPRSIPWVSTNLGEWQKDLVGTKRHVFERAGLLKEGMFALVKLGTSSYKLDRNSPALPFATYLDDVQKPVLFQSQMSSLSSQLFEKDHVQTRVDYGYDNNYGFPTDVTTRKSWDTKAKDFISRKTVYLTDVYAWKGWGEVATQQYLNQLRIYGNHNISPILMTLTSQGNATGETVLAVSASTYIDGAGKTLWPLTTWSWEDKMDGTGVPAAPWKLDYFDIYISQWPAASYKHLWRANGRVIQFNDRGYPLESETYAVTQGGEPYATDPDMHTRFVYRNDRRMSIATVANSDYWGGNAYTCDYQVSTDATYLDRANGWMRGQGNNNGQSGPLVEVANYASPFTDKSIHVKNAWGPRMRFYLTQGKDYVVSAWVLATSGTASIGGAYGYSLARQTHPITDTTTSAYGSCSTPYTTSTTATWQYKRFLLKASTDLTSSDWSSHQNLLYATIWVGVDCGTGKPAGEVYVSDIRVRPADALMSTAYYDKRNRVVCSVDANNKAVYKVYDAWDRVKQVLNDAKQVVKELSYKLYGDIN